ncbi:MAG TPA: galactokinase [Clostridiales bacterium]|nr:galactokinase [Clostridiales bacterium]
MQHNKLREFLLKPETLERLSALYGSQRQAQQQQRYLDLVDNHQDTFGNREQLYIVSAPGRTEIVGNHTDHNHGKVLAAAVNLDTLAVVSPREDMRACVHSQGYPVVDVDLNILTPQTQERGTSAALVRGVAARMAALGYKVGGFDAVVVSDVLGGSGLSSSAAYEVLVCAILDRLYNGFTVSPVVRAQIAQYAENEFFGKPCGLMDQMASSVGGLVAIDFGGETPVITPLTYGFAQRGHALVMVNTGGSHDDLVAEYAAIRSEMLQVAQFLGQATLRDCTRDQLNAHMPRLRETVGDRAILRSMHYFNENDRVDQAVQALKEDNLPMFLEQVNGSGRSSWEWLQNISASAHHQPMALALALAEGLLAGNGARRVHGGGFAGTTLNFVPDKLRTHFIAGMDSVFGQGACQVLDVRNEGAVAFG